MVNMATAQEQGKKDINNQNWKDLMHKLDVCNSYLNFCSLKVEFIVTAQLNLNMSWEWTL